MGHPALVAGWVENYGLKRFASQDVIGDLLPHRSVFLGTPMLSKNWTNPIGASAAKHISRPRADYSAAALLRGNMADSYCVSAVSTSSPCPAMANASSVASSMARLAPSPAYGDITCAASPSNVTPGERAQQCPIGKAKINRGMIVPSQLRMRSLSSTLQSANSLSRISRPAAASDQSTAIFSVQSC